MMRYEGDGEGMGKWDGEMVWGNGMVVEGRGLDMWMG